MRTKLVYLRLCLKKSLGYLPAIVAISLLLCVVIGVVLGAFVSDYLGDENKQRFKVGVIGNTEDSFLNFGIDAIMKMDTSRFAIEFTPMTEDEARSMMRRGELSAFIIVPDGFIDEISHGTVVSMKYVTASNAVGVARIFKSEVLSSVTDMMEASQDGIFGMQFAMEDAGEKKWSTITGTMNELFTQYISLILSRSNVASTEELGISDGVTLPGYFAAGLSLMFLLMWGITAAPMFSNKDIALSRSLSSERNGSLSQTFSEYLSYLFIMLVTVGLIVGVAGAFAGKYVRFIPEMAEWQGSDFTVFALRLIPVVLMVSALQYFIYEITNGIVGGTLTQFIAALSLSYVSGLFYPISFFPNAIVRISEYLPTGIARQYVTDCMTDNFGFAPMVILLLIFAAFMLLSAFIRNRRIAGRYGA